MITSISDNLNICRNSKGEYSIMKIWMMSSDPSIPPAYVTIGMFVARWDGRVKWFPVEPSFNDWNKKVGWKYELPKSMSIPVRIRTPEEGISMMENDNDVVSARVLAFSKDGATEESLMDNLSVYMSCLLGWDKEMSDKVVRSF